MKLLQYDFVYNSENQPLRISKVSL